MCIRDSVKEVQFDRLGCFAYSAEENTVAARMEMCIRDRCCAVRKPDGTIETKLDPTPTHGVWTKIPLVRGAISMIESLIMGYRYMLSLIHI